MEGGRPKRVNGQQAEVRVRDARRKGGEQHRGEQIRAGSDVSASSVTTRPLSQGGVTLHDDTFEK